MDILILPILVVVGILAVILIAAKFTPAPTLKNLVTKDSIIYVTIIEEIKYANSSQLRVTAKLDNKYYLYRNYDVVMYSLAVETIYEDKLDAIRNTILAETGILVNVEYIN
jgi:hypothetical protein